MSKTLLAAAVVAGLAGAASAQPNNVFKANGQVPIPDNTGPAGAVFMDLLVDASAVVGGTEIADLNIDLIVSHTWQGDVTLFLVSPGGVNVSLCDRPGVPQSTFGFSTDNYGNPATGEKMFFDDSAATTYDTPQSAGVNNVVGSWKSEAPLAVLNGTSIVGLWHLGAYDSAGGDVGSILNFSLHATTIPTPGSMALLGLGGLMAARRRMRLRSHG